MKIEYSVFPRIQECVCDILHVNYDVYHTEYQVLFLFLNWSIDVYYDHYDCVPHLKNPKKSK